MLQPHLIEQAEAAEGLLLLKNENDYLRKRVVALNVRATTLTAEVERLRAEVERLTPEHPDPEYPEPDTEE